MKGKSLWERLFPHKCEGPLCQVCWLRTPYFGGHKPPPTNKRPPPPPAQGVRNLGRITVSSTLLGVLLWALTMAAIVSIGDAQVVECSAEAKPTATPQSTPAESPIETHNKQSITGETIFIYDRNTKVISEYKPVVEQGPFGKWVVSFRKP